LVSHPADDFAPLWTPDGRRLLFLSDRTGSLGLWLLNVSDVTRPGPPALLKEDLGRVWPLGITRQGGYYYALQTGITDVYVASLDPGSGRLLDPPKPVSARLVGARQSPDWSPDGRHLVYPSDRTPTLRQYYGSSGTLSIYSVDTGEEKEIRTGLIRLGQTRWLPDGRAVLVKGWDDKEREGAYLIDIETGRLTTLVQPSGYMQMPELTPDGKTLFYRLTPEETGGFLLIARDVETGAERELYRHPAGFNQLALSPDGTELAFATGPVLLAISSRGGEPREVLRLSEPARITTIAWTPDGRQIFFGKGPAGEETVQVFRVPAEGGEPQKTDLAMKSLRGLRFHPDGRRVAFASGEYAEEVWVLENFLPTAAASSERH